MIEIAPARLNAPVPDPTHILSFEDDSRVYWFDGNYSDYEEDKRKRLGVNAAQPHRIRSRQLTR